MIAELPGEAGAAHVTPNVPAVRVAITRLRGLPGGLPATADGVTELVGLVGAEHNCPEFTHAPAWNVYAVPLVRPVMTHDRGDAGNETTQDFPGAGRPTT